MNDQTDEPQRTDEHSQIEVAPSRPLTRDKLMAGASVSAIVPRSFEEVWRVAQLVVKSGLAPRDLAQVERAAVAIMHGMEIGLKPMASMQRIAVINGRPSVWGDAVPAIALDTGQLVEWSEDITGTGDEMTAVCRVVRKMGGTTITKIGTFSVADAKKADLWDERKKVTRKGRDGSSYEKDNDSPWYRYPKRMLQMRARVAFRDLFSDAMCGLYIAEELVGRDSTAEMRDVTPQYERIANPLGGNGEEVPDKLQTREQMLDNALREAVDAQIAGTGGNQPQEQKVSQEPPGEAGNGKRRKRTRPDEGTVAEGTRAPTSPAGEASGSASPPPRPDTWTAAFPTPWNRQSSTSYVGYALAWMGAAPSQERAKERWTTERAIRNGIANPLDKEQMAACQEALGKVAT